MDIDDVGIEPVDLGVRDPPQQPTCQDKARAPGRGRRQLPQKARVDIVLPRPRELQRRAVHDALDDLVTERSEVVRVRVRRAERLLHQRAKLGVVRLRGELGPTRVVGAKERGIVGIEYEDPHASTVRWIQLGLSNSTAMRLLTGVALLRRDAAGVRFFVPYLRSLGATRSALGDTQPWLTFRAIRWLDTNLEPTMRVFEYGSGGSTLFFANRVRDVVSVEHDPEWHARSSGAIAAHGIRNCTYLLRPPQRVPELRLISTDRAYAGMDFTDYVTAIDAYPDESFDLVSVDGRARTACVLAAIPKARPGG